MFFGSTEPVVSRPPVEVRRGTEVVIPQSCCTFSFATTAQRLHETFLKCVLNTHTVSCSQCWLFWYYSSVCLCLGLSTSCD